MVCNNLQKSYYSGEQQSLMDAEVHNANVENKGSLPSVSCSFNLRFIYDGSVGHLCLPNGSTHPDYIEVYFRQHTSPAGSITSSLNTIRYPSGEFGLGLGTYMGLLSYDGQGHWAGFVEHPCIDGELPLSVMPFQCGNTDYYLIDTLDGYKIDSPPWTRKREVLGVTYADLQLPTRYFVDDINDPYRQTIHPDCTWLGGPDFYQGAPQHFTVSGKDVSCHYWAVDDVCCTSNQCGNDPDCWLQRNFAFFGGYCIYHARTVQDNAPTWSAGTSDTLPASSGLTQASYNAAVATYFDSPERCDCVADGELGRMELSVVDGTPYINYRYGYDVTYDDGRVCGGMTGHQGTNQGGLAWRRYTLNTYPDGHDMFCPQTFHRNDPSPFGNPPINQGPEAGSPATLSYELAL